MLYVSGNQCGDAGARALSKLLHVNRKLSVVHWDRNGTSPQGFTDVAAAMQRLVSVVIFVTLSALSLLIANFTLFFSLFACFCLYVL